MIAQSAYPWLDPLVTAVITIAGMWIINVFKAMEIKMQLDAQTAQLSLKTEQAARALAARTDHIAGDLGTKVAEVHDLVNSELARWKAEQVKMFEVFKAQQAELTAAAIKSAHMEGFAAGQAAATAVTTVAAKPAPSEVQP